MSKIFNQLQELINQKKALANNLTVKGQASSENETFNTLVPKVLNIASGDVTLGTKEIVDDGIYNAYEDSLDGYSQVIVNTLSNCDFVGNFNVKDAGNTSPKNIKMLKDVPAYAFINEKINSVDLTKSNSVGVSAFRESGLKNVIAPNPINVGSYAFYMCGSTTGEITISKEQNIIEAYTFYACTELKTKIHDDITKVDNYAFYNNFKNDWKSLPISLRTIGDYAFFSNIELKITEIPENVTTIGNYAFRGSVIENLKIYDACTSIGQHCFRYSNDLTSVEIGTGIRTMNTYCFADTSLNKLTIHRTIPPTLYSNTFYNCNLEVIEVPESTIKSYKSASNWSNYADIMVGIEGE